MSSFAKYFLIPFLVITVIVIAVAGKRGSMSRKPAIEVFSDMDRQLKLRPQTEFNFFADNHSSRIPVAGTVVRNSKFSETITNTGKTIGTTNFIELNPLPVTEKLMARGQERYQISCTPCHGAQGDGNGITKKFGMAIIANLHDPRIVKQPDGEIFNTITHGKGLMGPYGPNVTPEDRWAIIAYVRALQRSRLASIDDVAPEFQSSLKK